MLLSDKLGGGSNDVVKRPLKAGADDLDGEFPSNSEDELNSSEESSVSVEVEETFKANSETKKKTETSINIKQMELYFRTHSFLLIFSNSSLEWISTQLGPDNQELMKPFRNMPVIFQTKTKLFLSKWVDPAPLDAEAKTKLMMNPFPKDAAAVLNLIDGQYKDCLFFHNLADFDEMKHMFEKYYANKNPSKRLFRTSQLLKMTLVLLVSLMGKPENLLSSASSTPSSVYSNSSTPEIFSGEAILQLQEELLTNAVQYYFRVCVIGEGLETVEALLLFTIYLERNSFTPEIGYMILSLAVRFAQDLGIHRIETYESLIPEISFRRCRTWIMCCFMDMDLCFRRGSSPAINYHDVSPEFQSIDLYQFLKIDESFEFLHRFFIGIFRIRLQSYNRLFSATANLDSFESLRESLDFLNSEMFSVSMLIPEGQRPTFYNDPEFKPFTEVSTEEDEIRLTALLSYFVHMMVVNRLPLMFSFPQAGEEVLEMYRSLSLNSARTVLHLVKNLNWHKLNESFGTWSMFFPMSAFLHLLAACMNQPNSTEAIDDLNLMIDISQNFIGKRTNEKKLGYFAKLEVSTLLQILFKALLKITITIFEMKTGIAILKGNESLKAHLDLPSKSFPELYGNPEDFKATLSLYVINLNAKSPFTSGNKYSRMTSTTSTSNITLRTPANKVSLSMPPAQQSYNNYGIYSNSALNSGTLTDNLYQGGLGLVYDDVDSIINSQMSLFPNIFFDNNMQF